MLLLCFQLSLLMLSVISESGLASARFSLLSHDAAQPDDANAMTFTDVTVVICGFVMPVATVSWLAIVHVTVRGHVQARQRATGSADTENVKAPGGTLSPVLEGTLARDCRHSDTATVASGAVGTLDTRGSSLFPVTGKVLPSSG